MTSLTHDHWRTALFAAVAMALVAAQGLSGAHAAKYGDAPHDHHGVACVVSVFSSAGEKMLGAAAFAVTVVFAVWRVTSVAPRRSFARIVTQAPRPRGPPNR